MYKATQRIESFPDYHEFLDYDPQNTLFFDIETTGLSHRASSVFLIGTICKTADGWQMAQYFATPQEEETLLRQFLVDAEPFATLIHFNGSTFDLPYLEAKCRHYRLPSLMGTGDTAKKSIDLYQRFRPLKELLALKRINQSALEAFVGWHREDALTGKHMIAMCHSYTKTKDQELLRLMQLHNHDDLIGMTHILCLCSYLLLFQGKFDKIQTCTLTDEPALQITFDLAFPVPVPFHKELPRSDLFSGSCQNDQAANDPDSCVSSLLCRLTVDTGQAKLTLPTLTGELKYFFPDYRNYFYLPLEDQAIHRSVAVYVEKEYRVPAKPETCYTRKTDLFLPQPEAIFTPVFQFSYRHPALYFEYQDSVLQDFARLHRLTVSWLLYFLK